MILQTTPLTAADVMTPDVATASPRWPIAELERALCDKKVSGFPVVDGPSLVGVVSRSDVVRQLSLERSRAGELSDYYCGYDPNEETVLQSLVAEEHAVAERLSTKRVEDVMSAATFVVAPNLSIRDVAAVLSDHRIHRLPVVDRGELVGLLSSLDLVRLIAQGEYVPRSRAVS